ncbi:MAG TPA: 6-hydroxymethylpterin diphosphokinase MptE-like protein [Polyangia bacterium]
MRVETTDSPVQAVTASLGARAAGARALAAAIAAQHVETALARQQELAAVSARLPDLQRQMTRDAAALTADVVASIRTLMGDVKAADAAVAGALAEAGVPSLPLWLLAQGHVTEAALQALLEAPWDRDNDLLVLVGDGSWSIGQTLLARGHTRVMVLDRAAPETPIAPEGLDPSLWNVHDEESLRNVCTFLAWPLPKQVRVVQAGSAAVMPPAALRQLLGEILRFVGINQLQLMEESEFFVLKASRNLASVALTPSAAHLRGALAGWTAVVVSAGPSLDKNLHLLPALQGRVVIIAINQTVASLRRAGVRADIVVTVDPLNVSYHFEDSKPGDIGTLLLGTSVDPSLYKVPCDRIVNFSSSPMIEQWIYDLLGEDAGIGSGGTVSTGAIKVAAWLGCTTIISIGRDLAMAGDQYYAKSAADGGQDVAVSGDGQTISFGSYTRKLRLADGGGDRQAVQALLDSQVYELTAVPGFHGTPVKTTNLFVFEIEQVRRTVSILRGGATPIRFINATEGGAYLEGMEHMSLAAATAALSEETRDPNALIAARLRETADPTRAARMEGAMRALAEDLGRLIALCKEACELTAREGRVADRRRKQVSEEIAALCRTREFFSTLVQRATRTIVKKGGVAYQSVAEIAQAERALYAAIGTLASSLHPQVVAAAKRLGATAT